MSIKKTIKLTGFRVVLLCLPLCLAACGGSSSATSAPVNASNLTPTQPSKASEITTMENLGQNLTDTDQALQTNNMTAAIAAYKKFDNGWYDAEVYVRARSKDNYLAIEAAMAPLGKALLRTDNPVASDIIPLLATLQAKYDSAVKLAQTSSNPAELSATAPISGAEVASATAKVDQYLKTQVASFSKNTEAFVQAVKTKDLAQSKITYLLARQGYESIEFMASAFKNLDASVDARATDFPQAEQDLNWTGFHVLEKAIYVDGKLDANTDKVADKLLADVTQLSSQIKTMTINPTAAIAGGLELIEEIQSTKITGEEERYSHTDLNDFKANLISAKALYDAYSPFVKQRNVVLYDEMQTRFADIQQAIAPYFDPAGNVTTDYSKVDDLTRRTLAQKIEALANDFSQIGGTLGLQV